MQQRIQRRVDRGTRPTLLQGSFGSKGRCITICKQVQQESHLLKLFDTTQQFLNGPPTLRLYTAEWGAHAQLHMSEISV